ncbi:hypothetical protein EST38_g13755, partial [Candolleomyces aberdarensis]
GAAFNFVSNPQTRIFLQKWIPGSPSLDRHVLSGPILDTLANNSIQATRRAIEGRLATGQCDGWKNMAKQSVIASMLTVGAEPHIIRTHNVSARPKTGEELLKIVLEDIDYAEVTFLVKIVGWCSDDGGDGRKMRRLLAIERSWLIVLLCWAHQLNLVVGDLLSTKIALFECIQQAIEVIKWFNSHSRALGILNLEQASVNMNGVIFALILPVITRWTAHFCSLSRLEDVEAAMRAAWMKYSTQLISAAGPRREAKEKARSIQAIVEDAAFWKNIKIIRRILEPLAVAANILQAPNTRLFQVLLTLGNLYRIFSDPSIGTDVQNAVISSLEKRWAAADQDVFILSVVLNPYVRDRCFASGNAALTRSGLSSIARRVCERVLRLKCGPQFMEAFIDYLAERCEFSRAFLHLDEFEALAETNVWEGIDTDEFTGRNLVVKLAIHVQNIVANSAGCERLFSELGLVHTKKRCRLGLQKAEKSSRVRMDLKREHAAAGLGPKPRKRKLADYQASNQDPSAASQQEPEDDSASQRAIDFTTISSRLIRESEEDNTSSHEDPPEGRAQPLSSAAGGSNTGSQSGSPSSQTPTPAQKTQIPLALLFRYPSSTCTNPWGGFEKFWKGGVRGLEREVELHEILTEEARGDTSVDNMEEPEEASS